MVWFTERSEEVGGKNELITELPRGKRIPRYYLSLVPRVRRSPSRHGLIWFVQSSGKELTGGRRVPPQKTLSLLGMTGKETYRCEGSVRTSCLQTVREIPIPLPFRFHLQSSMFKFQTLPPIMDPADLVYSPMNFQEAHKFFHDGENSSSGDSTTLRHLFTSGLLPRPISP